VPPAGGVPVDGDGVGDAEVGRVEGVEDGVEEGVEDGRVDGVEDGVELGLDGGVVEPPQETPLIWQPVGRPIPSVMKPKLVDAPAARVPFQLAGVNVYVLPDADWVVFHELTTVVPAGRLSWTRHVVIVADVVLVTETSAW
jgi:hypothetical protein